MKYRAEIDGLRALAVVPVILFHAGFDLFSGGFVGVDVFFVISGYLITTILIEDIENNRFSILNFYERRARRILPALVLVTLVTVLASWFLMSPIDMRNFGNALIGVSTFSSNIVFWFTQGYFSESSELNPLVHTWSLAVEEQYYILFPVFLFLAWRFGKNRVFWMIVIIASISLAVSEWGWRNKASANFYLAPTRAWELISGSITAFIVQKRGVQANNALSLLGLVAILFAIFAYSESTPFPSVYALVPVIGVVLLIMFADEETFAAKLLSTRLFVGIGLISYSAYLWHQPLLALGRLQAKEIELPIGLVVTIVALSIFLAYLSWQYIEIPFRNRRFLSTKSVLSLSLTALIVLGGIGLLLKKVSNRYEYLLAEKLSTSEYVYFTNLDERKLIEGRLANPLRSVEALVMGSSRLMQIDSKALGITSLNISVSGASVEDNIAFVGEAVAKLRPSKVFLGADPWLFNRFDGQNRWKSSEDLYAHWRDEIIKGSIIKDLESGRYLGGNEIVELDHPLQKLYWLFHDDIELISKDGNVEAIAKKSYDGLHIYNKKSVALSSSVIERKFDNDLNYSMSKYEHDSEAKADYIQLIQWLQLNGIEVSLILSPYHPKLYERIESEKPIYIAIEKEFRNLGKDLNLKVIGSYDPSRVGCEASDFYDGMHPKDSLMSKLVNQPLEK